ncbi:MAG: GIDE domain-containing protein [Gemmatimonadaceae bacterium]
MSTTFAVILCFAAAGALAFLFKRYEARFEPKDNACSQILSDAFANSSDTADSVILQRLIAHQDKCMGDAEYVDQARRLYTNNQQFDKARTLLENADREHAFKPDELIAQNAWLDLAESHSVWVNGDEPRARELRDKGIAAANALRVKWPEWALPYRILEEAESESWAVPNGERKDYYRLEQEIKSGKLNGAFVRDMSETQAILFTFVISVIGLLGVAAGISAVLSMREMQSMTTSAIATAKLGYVELRGTLELAPNTEPVIGPFTNQPGVWYQLESRWSNTKNSPTHRERSAQPFVLRDASGAIVIEPKDLSVHTRHNAATRTGVSGFTIGKRAREQLLKVGDSAYVLGELSVTTFPGAADQRSVRVAPNGRRLLVSNYSEEELMSFEKLWLVAGVIAFVATALFLAWCFYQRYRGPLSPGSLL